MSHAVRQDNYGMGWMFALSTICHAVLYYFLASFSFTSLFTPMKAPVYYVDVVNLPVANPQAGLPGATKTMKAPIQSLPPPQMQMPAKANTKSATPAKVVKQTPVVESDSKFEERMARLGKEVEARHAAAAMEVLAKRAAGKA
ncbi:MAG: energy transducer TonB, partial [Geobacteraceae bacterium]